MAKRGLGSPNMSEEKKKQIQSQGGRSSHSGGRRRSRDTSDTADMAEE